jgi:hypothetical protein
MIAASLSLKLVWIDDRDGEPVRTMTRLTAFADDQPVWPIWGDAEGTLEIYCDDLLSYLTEFWQPLMLRQTYPIPVAIERPSQLRPEAERLWGDLPEDQAEEQEDAVAAFEDAHNLARCFGGQFDLPPLWIFRHGPNFIVQASDRMIRVRFWPTMEALIAVGNSIATRLANIQGNKWARLIERWHDRDSGEPDRLLAWATGQSRDAAASLLGTGILTSGASVKAIANDDDELRIAARMSGALPVHEIERLLGYAAAVDARATPELDALAREAVAVLTPDVRERLPFEQGVEVARWLREKLGLGLFLRAEPLQLLLSHRVFVKFEKLGLPNLDALAIWGRRHGPGVLMNLDSRRLALTSRIDAARSGAARITVAHELCHLLLDRDQALGVVDMVNSRMALATEQRARAFAAAFMLPGDAAVQVWEMSGAERTRDGIKAVLQRLSRRFGITTSVAAWKLEHGLRGQEPDVVSELDQISPQRRSFA